MHQNINTEKTNEQEPTHDKKKKNITKVKIQKQVTQIPQECEVTQGYRGRGAVTSPRPPLGNRGETRSPEKDSRKTRGGLKKSSRRTQDELEEDLRRIQ